MASAWRPQVSVLIFQLGWARLGARYTLVVSEHPGSDSDSPIRSDREGVPHFSGIRASQIRLELANRVGPRRGVTL